MKLKLVADENIPGIEDLLGPVAHITRVAGRDLQAEAVRDADALFVRSVTQVDAGLLEGSRVRFVGTATAGTDHIDKVWLRQQQIAFHSCAGSNANAVVEYVLAAIAETGDTLERLFAGARVGIVGYGHVGRSLAARLDALAIEWCAYDPWMDKGAIARPGTLADVNASDVICIHAELTRREPWPSHHLYDAAALDAIRSSQLLINASRGPVVDNAALKQRLSAANAPVAVLDVWEQEPQLDLELLELVRFGSAHIAGYSIDGKLRASRMLAEALTGSLGLKPPVVGSATAPQLELGLGTGPADRAAVVRGLLGQVYRLAEDDQLLRSKANDVPECIGTAFDELRRGYRQRRELAGAVLVGLRPQGFVRDIAAALGVLCA
ncbi:4-phosphoerythronate dehydrogenase [Halioglobus maricola]|uniref:Erythronate-4-phosphate dehydrogenase n=1 Tax=Halioglobus maricola TaxID=2601894 RepID=A0A5P9NJX8_9GAMM|nr:4-phosphoerythronate dehydrogenase [Halioglobus maricola]QFU76042.1 4-phosphoerythronate dehydrogenase [Halioglobus maricola]